MLPPTDPANGIHRHLSGAMMAVAACLDEADPPGRRRDLFKVARLLTMAHTRLTRLPAQERPPAPPSLFGPAAARYPARADGDTMSAAAGGEPLAIGDGGDGREPRRATRRP